MNMNQTSFNPMPSLLSGQLRRLVDLADCDELRQLYRLRENVFRSSPVKVCGPRASDVTRADTLDVALRPWLQIPRPQPFLASRMRDVGGYSGSWDQWAHVHEATVFQGPRWGKIQCTPLVPQSFLDPSIAFNETGL